MKIEFETQSGDIYEATSIDEAVEQLRGAQFRSTDTQQEYKEDIQDRCRKWDGSEIAIDDNRKFLLDLVRVGVITDFHVYHEEDEPPKTG